MLRDPKLQKKAINYGISKLNPVIQNVGSEALNQLSTKIRSKKKYKTNRKDLDGAGVISDILNPTKQVSDITGTITGGPTKKALDDWWSGELAKPAFSPKTGIFSGHSGPAYVDKKGNVHDLHFCKQGICDKDGNPMAWPAFHGGSIDIHKAIGELPRPQSDLHFQVINILGHIIH